MYELKFQYYLLFIGTISTNPQMVLGFLVIIAFGAASYQIGLDRFFIKNLTLKIPYLRKGWFRTLLPQ